MSDPNKSGDVYNSGEREVAEWDNGRFSGSTRIEDGHHSVNGRIDGHKYHRSWDKNGENDHSTLRKGWHENH